MEAESAVPVRHCAGCVGEHGIAEHTGAGFRRKAIAFELIPVFFVTSLSTRQCVGLLEARHAGKELPFQ